MKLYNVSVGSLILRFHIFTALIVALGFAGYLYLGIIIGMVLFLTSIVGLQFRGDSEKTPSMFPFKHGHIPAHRHKLWRQQHHWHRA